MDTRLDTYEVEGVTVELHADWDARNPYTEWDNLSELAPGPRLARDYDFGGETFARMEDASTLAVAARYLRLAEDCPVAIPFAFDSHGPMSNAYLVSEDGNYAAGFVVVGRAAIEREYGEVTPETIAQAEKVARDEFSTFAKYVGGEVYGYVVAPGLPEEDSLWGMYGCKYAKEEAASAARYAAPLIAKRERMEAFMRFDPSTLTPA